MFGLFRKAAAPILTLGRAGELAAQDEYRARGDKILAANFANTRGLRLGEVDFVARKGDSLVFVEVKTRAREAGRFGTGAEAVNGPKQARLLRAVKIFLQKHSEYAALRPQIDVCLVGLKAIDSRPEYVKILTNAVEDWN